MQENLLAWRLLKLTDIINCGKCNSVLVERFARSASMSNDQFIYECRQCWRSIIITRPMTVEKECGCIGDDLCGYPHAGFSYSKPDDIGCDLIKPEPKKLLIISVLGMPEDQRKEIEESMNNPNNDQYIWVFNKQVTTSEVET
jgi:hypothetical protein